MGPAIRALQGHYGAIESVDYRGKPVLAYSLPVPDTDWSMVVKEDVAEALEGIRRIQTAAIFGFLVVAALAFALWWWWLRSRRNAQQALRESRERFEKAFQASPDSITLVTLDHGTFVEVNSGFERFTGYSPAEAMGRNARDLDLWTDPAQREYLFAELRAGRTVSRLEARIRRKDGEIRVGQRFATRVEIGGVPHVLSIMRDITDQKKAEATLRASEEKFSKAFHASPDSIALSKLKTGEFMEVNEGFEKISGYSRDEAIGRTAMELGLWTQPEQRAALTTRLASGGAVRNLETMLRRKGGAERVVQISLDTIDLAGEKYMLTIGRDVTERRYAEEALKELNAGLEQRVQERTAKLEAANKELETFTYSVAHDLKGPLRGIDGYSRLLLAGYSDKLDDEGRQFLRNVRQAAQHMGELINDLLTYSRLERRDMQTGKVNPQELIEALLAERADEIEARGVAVTMAVSCTSATADREGLATALRNLLGNALKFTGNVPQPTIEIGGRDTGATCIFSVRDNGIGFDMKFHDRIFDIFQRLHRSEDYPGTGVGLAIVKKAMERMGGRAWAESEPGKGATFYLEIPE
jgi:PAS domain S-box-containing protein